MLGRNELCHCGSGKKYKKCCMEKDLAKKAKEAFEDKKNRIREAYASTVTKLNEKVDALLLSNEEYKSREDSCREEFFGVFSDNDSLNEARKDSTSAANRFFASYFIYDYPIVDNVSFAEMAVRGGDFTQEELNIVDALINSYPGMYDIAKKDEDFIVLRDSLSGKEYTTIDGELLKDFEIGDTILGRPVKIEDSYLLIDMTIRILPSIKEVISSNLVKEYEKLDSNKIGMDTFISLNSLYFYRYMVYLLDTIESDKEGNNSESVDILKEDSSESNEKVDTSDLDGILDDEKEVLDKMSESELGISEKIADIIKNKVSDSQELKDILNTVDIVSKNIAISGKEEGWAAGFEYYFKKSSGISTTQGELAKKYGVSASTLARRYKEIDAVL